MVKRPRSQQPTWSLTPADTLPLAQGCPLGPGGGLAAWLRSEAATAALVPAQSR